MGREIAQLEHDLDERLTQGRSDAGTSDGADDVIDINARRRTINKLQTMQNNRQLDVLRERAVIEILDG